jgi:hypothetical protein
MMCVRRIIVIFIRIGYGMFSGNELESNTHFLRVALENETVCLNAYQMAELFGRVSKSIRNEINEDLSGSVVGAKFASTIRHDVIKEKFEVHDMDYCLNLDVSIS